MMNWIKIILELIFPKKCIICKSHRINSHLCIDCWKKIDFISKPNCSVCSYSFEYEPLKEALCGACILSYPMYDKAIAAFKYNENSKELIHQFKYKDNLHILNFLADLLSMSGKDIIKQTDIITVVPMHKKKFLKRGYNQAALLAMKIAKKYNLKYLPELLIKKKNIIPQADLKKKERIENVKNVFKYNYKYLNCVEGKNILLIDDVITTGATINECCKILKDKNPNKIFVLALAKRV